ncbi:hypothetical protein BVI1335_2570006 [Burkholderia vietnamiensis]|nr:hypothetical protein BVI1335_2570006 [Burkholderia vietnamiensis]
MKRTHERLVSARRNARSWPNGVSQPATARLIQSKRFPHAPYDPAQAPARIAPSPVLN